MDEFIEVSEAASMSGKSKSTIKRWASQSLIESIKNEKGRWLFNPQSIKDYLIKNANQRPPTNRSQASRGLESETMSPIMGHLQSLQEALERERQINDELRKKLDVKDGELLKMTYEIKAILSQESKGLLSRWIRSK